MNKNILVIVLVVLGGIVLAGSIWAATNLSFSPANINVVSGETFSMVISVNPQEVKNYTVKTEIEFPADLLEVKSFSFGNNWMPLSQSGYDLIDNTNGLLIKTAGYPGGLSSTATFGIISFSAKKSGSGTIKLSSNSLALDSENQNVLSSSLAQVAISITAPASVVPGPIYLDEETEEIEEVEEIEEAETIGDEGEEEIVIEPEEKEEQPVEEASFLAAIGNLASFGTSSISIGIIVLIIALLIIFFIIKGIRLRKSR